MGRKKFIEKKKSATFQLLARDSADPNYNEGPSGDRVFVRVDNNNYTIPDFGDEDADDGSVDTHSVDDPYSKFADAPGDEDEDEVYGVAFQAPRTRAGPLPDNIRREILELGFPDDGYNYLLHLREIKNTGGGSAYYENSKAKLDQVTRDVKAYDASRVHVPGIGDDLKANSIYTVAAKTFGVKVQKAVDPEVAALLDDDDDLSRFGSDVEDLEEDFVVQANLPEEGEHIIDEEMNLNEEHKVSNECSISSGNYYPEGEEDNAIHESRSHQVKAEIECVDAKPRVRRLLDEQFDLLTLQEYGTESENEYDGSISAEDEPLAEKLNSALKNHVKDDLELEGKYRVPADILHENEGSNNDEVVESAVEVIRRCAEYAEMYENEHQDNDEVVIVEESSDESEVWDCETIVSTYSNLDNHPGKIEAPRTRKKIILRGKEQLPVDSGRSHKVKETPESESTQPKEEKKGGKPHNGEAKKEKKEPGKPHSGDQSKEEKKERK
ncbi:hypothetical protein AQUCO_00100240v1 [Aquilegia coerulea]|nr:hypothetical protein AQUCO_00100240v1 [Aquilegia coerulea]